MRGVLDQMLNIVGPCREGLPHVVDMMFVSRVLPNRRPSRNCMSLFCSKGYIPGRQGSS